MRSRFWLSRLAMLAALFVLSAACRGPQYAPRRPMPKPPLTLAQDEVANGLVNQASRGAEAAAPAAGNQPAGNPGAAADRSAAPLQPGERMLVQSGHVRVEVSRAEDSIAAFLTLVKGWQGYLHSQEGTSVTVRLPAARFEEGFAWLRASGRVLEESRQAEDVTEEYVDLAIRIDNAKKARERLLEVLKTTTKVDEVLQVESQLRRLTEELEIMEGRQKALADRVAMASLQATFQSLTAAAPTKRTRQPSRFAWINELGAERMMGDY